MTQGAVIDTLHAAGEDAADVVKLTRELVRVPSRGGIDSYDPVLETMAAWLGDQGLACRRPCAYKNECDNLSGSCEHQLRPVAR